jgi:addiction module HigA family antidote
MLREEFVAPLGLTQMELAAAIGLSFQSVNAILNRRRSVTPDVALRLERLFGMEAQFWLNLQLAWDLYHEMHGPKRKERARIKRHPALAGA